MLFEISVSQQITKIAFNIEKIYFSSYVVFYKTFLLHSQLFPHSFSLCCNSLSDFYLFDSAKHFESSANDYIKEPTAKGTVLLLQC